MLASRRVAKSRVAGNQRLGRADINRTKHIIDVRGAVTAFGRVPCGDAPLMRASAVASRLECGKLGARAKTELDRLLLAEPPLLSQSASQTAPLLPN